MFDENGRRTTKPIPSAPHPGAAASRRPGTPRTHQPRKAGEMTPEVRKALEECRRREAYAQQIMDEEGIGNRDLLDEPLPTDAIRGRGKPGRPRNPICPRCRTRRRPREQTYCEQCRRLYNAERRNGGAE